MYSEFLLQLNTLSARKYWKKENVFSLSNVKNNVKRIQGMGHDNITKNIKLIALSCL